MHILLFAKLNLMNGSKIMKKAILDLIKDMRNDVADTWENLNLLLLEGHSEYESEYGGNFVGHGYEGDSISHMLDICEEQSNILNTLYDFVESLQEKVK